ncbi:AAA family ATPase [Curtobacterium sp. L1-20]|uniref:helix-turn-helix transcriptional regulator n=1 Tax=Curtobacterium sp. L1-20 TaxID=3138181 RepID=UPI003B520F1C
MPRQRDDASAHNRIPLERRALLERMVRVAGERGGRLAIIGEPGVGKTTMLEALAERLSQDRIVIMLRFDEGSVSPFSAVRTLLRLIPERIHRTLPIGYRAALEQVLQTAPPEFADHRMLEAALRYLCNVLAAAHTVVILDDAHLADRESVDLMAPMFRPPHEAAGTVLIVARELDAGGPVTSWKVVFTASQLAFLAPLSPAAVAGVLKDSELEGLSATDVTEIVSESGGNPSWAVDLAMARLSGDDRPAAATSRAVASTIGRLERLPAPVRELLSVTALMRTGTVEALFHVVGQAEEALAEGVSLGVLSVKGHEVAVRTPLLRAATLELLSAPERRTLHAAIAEAPLPAEARLEHRDDAVLPGPRPDLAEELRAAAGRARRIGTTSNALRLALRSVARSDGRSDAHVDRVLLAAELAGAQGDSALVRRLSATLDPAKLPPEQFDRIAVVSAEAIAQDLGVDAVDRRLANARRSFDSGDVRTTIIDVLRLLWSTGDATDVAHDIESRAAELPPEVAPNTLQAALADLAFRRLDAGEGLSSEIIARARAVESVSGTVELTSSSASIEAIGAYQADDLGRSRPALTAFIRTAELLDAHPTTTRALAHASIVEVLAGRVVQATSLLQDAEQHALRLVDPPAPLTRARGLLALTRNDRETLDEIMSGWTSPAATIRGSLLLRALAGVDAAWSDNWSEARAELEVALELAEAKGIVEPGRRLWIDIELARARVHLGDLEGAERVARHLSALDEVYRRPHAHGQALRIRAMVAMARGDQDESLRLAEDAVEELRRGGFAPESARAQLDRAQLLLDAGRIGRARQVLADVTTTRIHADDPRIAARTLRLTEAADAGDGRALLTAAETRVAQAAAAGRTNREIAAQLFVSVRTVETHLGNAYRKMGVRTRTQLALALNDLGQEGSGAA